MIFPSRSNTAGSVLAGIKEGGIDIACALGRKEDSCWTGAIFLLGLERVLSREWRRTEEAKVSILFGLLPRYRVRPLGSVRLPAVAGLSQYGT